MSPSESSDGDRSSSRIASGSNLLGLGWQIASTLLVFTGGGYALDRWLDTIPWFLLTGALLGMVSVFVQIFRIASALDREEKERKRQKRTTSSDTNSRPGTPPNS